MPPGDHSTKEQMLDAGLRLFGEGRAPILRSLTAGTIAKEAGFHRQTFYRHWETQDDYMGDLVRRVFAVPDFENDGDPRFGMGRGADFDESVRGQARREFDALERDPTMLVRVGLVAMGQVSDGASAAVAADYYRAVHQHLRVTYTHLLDSWDRCPRPPLQIDDVVMALRTQLAGIVLQVAVSGDQKRGRRLYLEVALGLLRDMTEPCGAGCADGSVALSRGSSDGR